MLFATASQWVDRLAEAHASGRLQAELARLQKGAALCARLGLECHMGHGLSYADVAPVAAIPEVRELNIGHFLVGEAIFVGLDAAIREMRRIMDAARAGGAVP